MPVWSPKEGRETACADDWTVGAQLYSDVCRILLLVHDPHLPSLGLDRGNTVRYVDEKVKQYVRRMCGVALSHPQSQPAISITGMVIAMCTSLPSPSLFSVITCALIHMSRW